MLHSGLNRSNLEKYHQCYASRVFSYSNIFSPTGGAWFLVYWQRPVTAGVENRVLSFSNGIPHRRQYTGIVDHRICRHSVKIKGTTLSIKSYAAVRSFSLVYPAVVEERQRRLK